MCVLEKRFSEQQSRALKIKSYNVLSYDDIFILYSSTELSKEAYIIPISNDFQSCFDYSSEADGATSAFNFAILKSGSGRSLFGALKGTLVPSMALLKRLGVSSRRLISNPNKFMCGTRTWWMAV